MKPRKLRIPRDGKPLPALTQLKRLPAEKRQHVFSMLNEKSYEDTARYLAAEWDLKLSASALHAFRQWQFQQNRMENYNALIEQFESFYKAQNPLATPDRIREASMGFFMAEATANQDLEGFLSVASLDLKERSARTNFELKKKQLGLAERKVILSEAKTRAASAVEETARKVKMDPETKRELLAAIDKKLLGE